jgi:hypothetical protein
MHTGQTSKQGDPTKIAKIFATWPGAGTEKKYKVEEMDKVMHI